MFAVPLLVGSFQAGAAGTTFDVANDHVTCNTTSGSIAFAPPLTATGTTTGALTTKMTMVLAGCSDTDNGSVNMFTGKTTMTLSSNIGTNCAGLLGLIDEDGESQIVWTPAAGQAFTPKTPVGTAQKAATNVHFNQLSGGLFSVTGEGPWAATYGSFSMGTAYSTAAPSSVLDFTGRDGAGGGSEGWLAATTSEDIGNILAQCTGTAGLKLLHFGNGSTHWGGSFAFPANGSTTTCAATLPCSSPTVPSPDGSTSLQVTAAASANPQTVTVQVGTGIIGPKVPAKATPSAVTRLQAMQCTLSGSVSVVSGYHTTAVDAPKTALYTTHGAAATFANNFFTAHPNTAGCYGQDNPFMGWSPSTKTATWRNGPYTYGPATLDASTGLHEAFLDNCGDVNHPNVVPCFLDTNGSSNILEVHSPASLLDPRVSH